MMKWFNDIFTSYHVRGYRKHSEALISTLETVTKTPAGRLVDPAPAGLGEALWMGNKLLGKATSLGVTPVEPPKPVPVPPTPVPIPGVGWDWKWLSQMVLLGLIAFSLLAPNFSGCHLHWPVIPIPTPGPGPTPPAPAPIPTAGLRVLIVYDTTNVSKLPASQQEILTDGNLRSYLNSHCVKGADGKTPEWRIFDQKTDVSNESPIWQAAMQRSRGLLPTLLISTGKSGYEGPLPADGAATLALVTKYGGS
ncbi:MAG: hypothetical protein KGL39_00375 [Patescibacteria group bacterium]|nr:hypothetical protein [Patescibacteria group bacterium]